MPLLQVHIGREGSDEDADEVTGGEKRGSSDKKRKGDVSQQSMHDLAAIPNCSSSCIWSAVTAHRCVMHVLIHVGCGPTCGVGPSYSVAENKPA